MIYMSCIDDNVNSFRINFKKIKLVKKILLVNF